MLIEAHSDLDNPRLEDVLMNRGFDRDTIERAARMYKSNQDACVALGITLRGFGRLCRKYEVKTPYEKRRQQLSSTSSRAA